MLTRVFFWIWNLFFWRVSQRSEGKRKGFRRKFIGIDKETEYLDLSIKRYEDLKKDIKRKGRQDSLKAWETNGKG